jgi:metallo-beta-lactamase class B
MTLPMTRSTLLLLFAVAGAVSAQQPPLAITHLTGGFYIYTTYKSLNGTLFPSNSMYVVTKEGVILIDTPWDVEQTGPLLDSIGARHRMPVVLCLVTHFHDDRTAGLDILKARGIATWSTRQTFELAAASGDRQAEHTFERDTTFSVGGVSFGTYYPGEGHTKDNIVVWFPKQRVLFGGCLVKSVESKGLGNTADASLDQWGRSIRAVMKRYRRARYIIPGHFGWTGRRSLAHTLELLRDVE